MLLPFFLSTVALVRRGLLIGTIGADMVEILPYADSGVQSEKSNDFKRVKSNRKSIMLVGYFRFIFVVTPTSRVSNSKH